MPPSGSTGRPTTMDFHDLTTRLKLPKNLHSLLGINLKFIHNPQRNAPWAIFDGEIIPRFERDLRIKIFIAGEESSEPYNPKYVFALNGPPTTDNSLKNPSLVYLTSSKT
jgi:hypothetical protein